MGEGMRAGHAGCTDGNVVVLADSLIFPHLPGEGL